MCSSPAMPEFEVVFIAMKSPLDELSELLDASEANAKELCVCE